MTNTAEAKLECFSLVLSCAVGAVLPRLPCWDLDLGVVGCSQPKVWIDDNFVHLQTCRYLLEVAKIKYWEATER